MVQSWTEIENNIQAHSGAPFSVAQQRALGGGSINSAMLIEGEPLNGTSQRYFIKFNRADLLDMFEAEAQGLAELESAQVLRTPHAVCSGTSGQQSYLVMEYLPLSGGQRGSAQQLGVQLAALHRKSKPQFGWFRDNTIGSTPQINRPAPDWVAFWREQRLGFQLQLAQRNGAPRGLLNKGDRLMDDLDAFFNGYQPQPSLLHGDLWSGNYGYSAQGEPVIYDPAVYYGDREADLAMTELFGGFPREFYAAYDEAWQIDPGYKVRKTLYNLYHILNHFNLFGGGYASQAESMLDQLLSEIR